MRNSIVRRLVATMGCCLLMLIVGCSSEPSTRRHMTGKLHRGGTPLKVDRMLGEIEIVFHPFVDGERPKPVNERLDARPPGELPPGEDGQPQDNENNFNENETGGDAATVNNTDGAFTVSFLKNGKYLVTVAQYPKGKFDTLPNGDDKPESQTNKLYGRYDLKNSPIIFEVTDATTHIDIDLSQYKK